MSDLIIFSLKESLYAIDLEYIKRIIQVPKLTDVPNDHPLIEGMMSYEESVIKVVGFRQMLEYESYDEELRKLFNTLKGQHKAWVEALENTVENGVTFSKTTNPHMCELGKWLDAFNSYDENVSNILRDLNAYHKKLHGSAVDILELLEQGKEDEAKAYFNSHVREIYSHTIAHIDTFINEFALVADSLQKLLIYQNGEALFALKVDAIEDILHADEQKIMQKDEAHKVNAYLELEGVIEIDDKLINVIKKVTLPIKEVA